MNLLFHPEAEAELKAAIGRREDIVRGSGLDFAAEVHAAIDRALRFPDAFAELAPRIHRVLTHNFLYGVLYARDETTLHVLAIMHLGSGLSKRYPFRVVFVDGQAVGALIDLGDRLASIYTARDYFIDAHWAVPLVQGCLIDAQPEWVEPLVRDTGTVTLGEMQMTDVLPEVPAGPWTSEWVAAWRKLRAWMALHLALLPPSSNEGNIFDRIIRRMGKGIRFFSRNGK